MKLPPAIRSICGTDAGYQKHYRSNEDACSACLNAHRIKAIKYNKRAAEQKENTFHYLLSKPIDTEKIEQQLTELGVTHLPIGSIISKANCIGRTNLLFPVEGDYSAGKSVCQNCPMQDPCRTTGITEVILGESPMGMYGGLTPQELHQEAIPILAELKRSDEELELRLEQVLRVAVELSKTVHGPQNHVTNTLRDLQLETEISEKWWDK